MSFRGHLRPGQGFKRFLVFRREGDITAGGRPYTGALTPDGEIIGMITEATPKEMEQWKQRGTPITHTILQRGTNNRAKATDVLELPSDPQKPGNKPRRFQVVGDPKDPGELGHFLIYRVEERKDLQ